MESMSQCYSHVHTAGGWKQHTGKERIWRRQSVTFWSLLYWGKQTWLRLLKKKKNLTRHHPYGCPRVLCLEFLLQCRIQEFPVDIHVVCLLNQGCFYHSPSCCLTCFLSISMQTSSWWNKRATLFYYFFLNTSREKLLLSSSYSKVNKPFITTSYIYEKLGW